MPRAYPLVPRHENSGVRRVPHGDYLIFYRVTADTVEILHILHGARDYEPIMFPDE
jgi:toxin ParE1/3/4